MKVVLMSGVVISRGRAMQPSTGQSKGWLNRRGGSWFWSRWRDHITIVSVTVVLHRHQAHRALDPVHPSLRIFRFWL
ncbi:MAG: hypothetical protein IPH64_17655 [Comamonadaceae bacterium]|nr:hypothetical protein [Comamonadaceae bacterium]